MLLYYLIIPVTDIVKVVGILILTPIQGASWQIKNAMSFPSAPKGTSEAVIYTALKDLHAEEEEARRTGGKIPHPSNNNFKGGKIFPATNSLEISSTHSTSSSSLSDNSVSADGDSEDKTPLTATSETSSSVAEFEDADGDDGKSEDSTTSSSASGKTRKTPSPVSPHARRRREGDRVSVTFGLSAAPTLEPVHNLRGWKMSALSKTYGKVLKSAKLLQRGEFRVCFFFQIMFVGQDY